MFWNCKITAPVAAFSALATLVGLHHAPGQGGDHTLPVLRVLDADGNGELSAAEIDGAAAALRTLDGDRDGRLSHTEMIGAAGIHVVHADHLLHAAHDPHAAHAAHGEYSRGEILAALHFLLQSDANGDGALDEAEMRAAARQAAGRPDLPGSDLPPDKLVALIRTHDTDGDGRIQRTELLQQAHHLMSEDGAAEATTPHAPHPTAPDTATLIEHHFLSNDRNGDGKVGREEVPAQGIEMFESGDTNSDGVLDRAEIRALAEHYAELHARQALAPRKKAL